MGESRPPPQFVGFGAFEVDLRSGELHRDGRKIPLQDKPFQILALLLERPGELVTRDELRERLWPGHTFVDFDHGLNTAVKKLRHALEDSADRPQHVETLARRGYRFLAPIAHRPSASPTLDPGASAPAVTRAADQPRARGRARVWAGTLAAMGLTVALVALAVRVRPRPESASVGRSPSLVVLPFENLGGSAEDEYLADGLTETLTTELARVPGLLVIARNSAFQYKGQAVDVRRVGAELGVQHVLEGSVQRSGTQLRVNAQLIDAGSGYHVWSQKYDRPASDVFNMQDEIGRGVRQALRIQLNPAGAVHGQAPHTMPEAYDAYLRGMYRLYHAYPRVAGPPDLDDAIRWLERAVALDSQFALGHAMLARAYARKFFFKDSSPQWQEKAFVEVEKALALDPTLAEAYVARGDLTWTRASRFPHEAAMAEFRRALNLNPNVVTARWEAARIYQHVGLFDRALAELEAARRLDPKDPSVTDRRGKVLVYQRDYAGALESFEAVGTPNTERALALWGAGRAEEARVFLAEYLRRNPEEPDGPAFHALILARSGEHRRAREEIDRAVRLDRGYSHMHHSQYYIGAAYSVMGDRHRAIEWLQRAASEGFPCYPYFATDPDLAALAGDARFQAFLARLKAQWEGYRATL